MENQKIENLLNMSMEVDEQQREQSRELSAGFDAKEKTWEIIIKYSGDAQTLEEELGMTFVILLNQFAISRGTRSEIERLARHPRVEFIEKPKALLYGVTEGIRVSCIYQLQPPLGDLSGKGVLIGIVDSGIDIFHPDFINEDGTTRIVGLWDQTGSASSLPKGGQPPKGYKGGIFYSREQIDEAISLGRERGRDIVPAADPTGHGTHVAGICAGNGRASGGTKKGAAPGAELLIVKLGNPASSDFPRTTQLMAGVDFAVRYSLSANIPLVLNLSLGNNYGSHSGDSLVENYLGSLMGLGRITIVTGTGNEGSNARHTSGYVKTEEGGKQVQFIVGPYESGFGLQLWKNYADVYDIILEHPLGDILGPFSGKMGLSEFQIRQTEIFVYFGTPSPYSASQEIYISFLPVKEGDYVDSGIWAFYLLPRKIVTGAYDMWLPDSGLASDATKFLKPETATTLTIPSTTEKVISVAAYDAYTDRVATFSGRGYTVQGLVKPDLAAPGVNIESCVPGGGYGIKSGTSMAAPFVSGGAALMMEWGEGVMILPS